MYYKVKEEGRVINRYVYNILGISAEDLNSPDSYT